MPTVLYDSVFRKSHTRFSPTLPFYQCFPVLPTSYTRWPLDSVCCLCHQNIQCDFLSMIFDLECSFHAIIFCAWIYPIHRAENNKLWAWVGIWVSNLLRKCIQPWCRVLRALGNVNARERVLQSSTRSVSFWIAKLIPWVLIISCRLNTTMYDSMNLLPMQDLSVVSCSTG